MVQRALHPMLSQAPSIHKVTTTPLALVMLGRFLVMLSNCAGVSEVEVMARAVMVRGRLLDVVRAQPVPGGEVKSARTAKVVLV